MKGSPLVGSPVVKGRPAEAPQSWFSPKKPLNPATVKVKKGTHRLAVWTRQLQVLLDSGVSLAESLHVLHRQCEDPLLQEILVSVTTAVERGASLSQAMSAYPRVFSRVFIGLVQAGESTGKLTDVLSKLADMLERESALVQRMTAAFTYPLFVLAVTATLTLFVFYAILPNFITIFRDQHLKLPFITEVLIFITDSVRNPGAWLVSSGLALGLYTALKRVAASRQGALQLFRLAQSIPVVGPSLHYASLARFCWIMESMSGSGIPLIRCVDMASKASGSPVLESHGRELCASVQQGLAMSAYLLGNPETYPKMMGQMALMAEESGGFEEVFGRLATWFNQEMEARLDLLNAMIEPLLMAVVAVIVGCIVIGIFLPLYALVGNLGT